MLRVGEITMHDERSARGQAVWSPDLMVKA
jgi:hypothetical protein